MELLHKELNDKLNILKQSYNSNKSMNTDSNDISKLLEINKILTKLIQIGKYKIAINKQLSITVGVNKEEMEMELE